MDLLESATTHLLQDALDFLAAAKGRLRLGGGGKSTASYMGDFLAAAKGRLRLGGGGANLFYADNRTGAPAQRAGGQLPAQRGHSAVGMHPESRRLTCLHDAPPHPGARRHPGHAAPRQRDAGQAGRHCGADVPSGQACARWAAPACCSTSAAHAQHACLIIM